MLDMSGKIAFVAGAGSVGSGWGNGRATAVLLARQGAKVFGTDLNPAALAVTTEIMRKEGRAWEFACADMTNSGQVKGAVDACIRQFGKIDVLVNNIGGSVPGDPVSLSEADWERQIDLNLTTAFLSCKYVLPHMTSQFDRTGKGGAIVNVSSIAHMSHQLQGRVMVAYAAAKAGLVSFTRATAIAYVKQDIRANTVIVGMMDTPTIARLTSQFGVKSQEEMRAARDALVPMGRMGDAWDVANAIVFLASDEARYITATQLVVDGGVTAAR